MKIFALAALGAAAYAESSVNGVWYLAQSSTEKIQDALTSGYASYSGQPIDMPQLEEITESIRNQLVFNKERVNAEISSLTADTVGYIIESGTTLANCHASCDNDFSNQANLYQWQVEIFNEDDDRQLAINTCFFVCRYGTDSQTEPKCPATSCSEGRCEQCYDWRANDE